MTESNELSQLLDIAADVLAESNVEGILIGGCARNVYAPPRGTKDVDLAVSADERGYRSIVRALADRSFVPTSTVSSDADDPVPDITIFQNIDVGRIDVLVSKTPFETRAISDAIPFGRLRVATLEDLIAYKLIAGRSRDYSDIEDVVRTQARGGRAVDWDAIEASVAPWEIEDRIALIRSRIER